MRIKCDRCGSSALIRKRRDVAPGFTIFYCLCSNVDCAHSFTAELTLGHTISPSALDLPQGAADKVKACGSPREVRQLLLPLGLAHQPQQA